MKPAFSNPAIIMVFLLLSAICVAQNNQPANSSTVPGKLKTITTDTLKKINGTPCIAAAAKTDSLKTKKTANRKKKKEIDYSLYQINTPDTKPLPYNTYRESRREPVRTDSLGGEILRTILKNNIRN